MSTLFSFDDANPPKLKTRIFFPAKFSIVPHSIVLSLVYSFAFFNKYFTASVLMGQFTTTFYKFLITKEEVILTIPCSVIN